MHRELNCVVVVLYIRARHDLAHCVSVLQLPKLGTEVQRDGALLIQPYVLYYIFIVRSNVVYPDYIYHPCNSEEERIDAPSRG